MVMRVTRSSSAVCWVNTYPRLASASRASRTDFWPTRSAEDEQLVILIVGVGHRREAYRALS